jgi:hypothetical protein
MPEYWGEKKRRGAVAQNLGWMLTNDEGKKRPDVTRVKDAIMMCIASRELAQSSR